jgi:hypothetical protein
LIESRVDQWIRLLRRDDPLRDDRFASLVSKTAAIDSVGEIGHYPFRFSQFEVQVGVVYANAPSPAALGLTPIRW